jgi:hypothetical protein
MSHAGHHSSSTDPSPHSLLGPIKGIVRTPPSPAPILTLIFHPSRLEHHPHQISTVAATAPHRPAISSVLPLPSAAGEVPLLPLFPSAWRSKGLSPRMALCHAPARFRYHQWLPVYHRLKHQWSTGV